VAGVQIQSDFRVTRPGFLNLDACGGGGEDFHFFKTKKPSTKTAYFGIGVGATPGLHDRNMTLEEKYLPNGTKMWEALAKKLLG
jgi:amidohydrolase